MMAREAIQKLLPEVQGQQTVTDLLLIFRSTTALFSLFLQRNQTRKEKISELRFYGFVKPRMFSCLVCLEKYFSFFLDSLVFDFLAIFGLRPIFFYF